MNHHHYYLSSTTKKKVKKTRRQGRLSPPKAVAPQRRSTILMRRPRRRPATGWRRLPVPVLGGGGSDRPRPQGRRRRRRVPAFQQHDAPEDEVREVPAVRRAERLDRLLRQVPVGAADVEGEVLAPRRRPAAARGCEVAAWRRHEQRHEECEVPHGKVPEGDALRRDCCTFISGATTNRHPLVQLCLQGLDEPLALLHLPAQHLHLLAEPGHGVVHLGHHLLRPAGRQQAAALLLPNLRWL
mmetsp:Transcript_45601/g.71315  ORF Transcript_45601/g.71315 Transcript_45601/m.71315 type:complete len:241 (-) Transcript_45601:192-914(-)